MDSPSINRRTLVKLGAAAMAGAAVPGYAGGRSRLHTLPGVSGGTLPRVQVSSDRVIRAIGGLRPFRPSGFVLCSERIEKKTFVHNYGHGGCGITLSWGTAKLAVEEALKQPHRKAAVLGCGVVGLASARLLQDHGFEVTIYTRDLPPNTTSNVAGGLWAPFSIADPDRRTSAFDAQLAQSSRFSHRYYQSLVGDRYGIRWLPLYMPGEDQEFTPPWPWTLAPELYPVTTLGREDHPFPSRWAARVYLMLIEPAIYLPSLLADFRIAGGRLVVRDFPDLAAVLQLKEPLIVNCTGLGAKALFGDEELIPIKGQLSFLVPQPELNYMYISEAGYMFPRRDGVLLGGTHEEGVWSPEPDPETIKHMLERHRKFMDGMR